MLLVGFLRSIGTMMIGWSKAPDALSKKVSVDPLLGRRRANSLTVVVRACDCLPPSLFTVADEVAIRRGLGTLYFLESQERALSSSFSKILRSSTSLGFVFRGTCIILPAKDNSGTVYSVTQRNKNRYSLTRSHCPLNDDLLSRKNRDVVPSFSQVLLELLLSYHTLNP